MWFSGIHSDWVFRLKAEVEKRDVQYNESLAQLHSRYSLDGSSLREQLAEEVSRREMLEHEVQLAKDKLDAARLENLTDSEETISELTRRHEREKMTLREDNKKLLLDLEMVSACWWFPGNPENIPIIFKMKSKL